MENKIACVVLNYNSYQDTIKCVDNILKYNETVEVVVSDNNSIDESYKILKDRYTESNNVYTIRNDSNSGYSAGNNYGIHFILEANPNIEYICIMNPDTLFDNPALLNKMQTILASNDDIAIVAPTMILRGKKVFNRTCWLLPKNFEFLKRLFVGYKWKTGKNYHYKKNNLAYTDAVHGAFFMIKKTALERINFFDENIFLYSEENLIGFKIKNIEMKEAVLTEEFFYHNHPIQKERLSLRKKIKNARIGSNSRLYICKLYYPRWLYPVAWVATKINMSNIVIKHVGGSLVKIIKGE